MSSGCRPQGSRFPATTHLSASIWRTSLDDDALFALATGGVDASVDLVSELAARAVADAVREGVRHAQGMPGCPADPRVRHPAGTMAG